MTGTESLNANPCRMKYPFTTSTRIQIGCFLLALIYVVFRAWNVGFTHDEALTWQIITGNEDMANTANNHWLNTWLSALFFHLPVKPEFALRLPNVLGFILFGWFVLRIAVRYFSTLTGIALVLLLLGNAYLLDYFSLSRGYGISLGMLLACLYYLLLPQYTYRTALFASLFAIGGVLANLNFTNLFLLVHLWLFIRLIRQPETRTFRSFLLFIPFIIVGWFVVNRLFFLKNNNQLYFGVESFNTTLDYLIYSVFYNYQGFKSILWIRGGFVILTIISVCLLWKQRDRVMFLLFYLTFGSIGILVIQHYGFHTLYPLDRSSILFIPLFILFFAASFDRFSWKRASFSRVIPGSILSLAVTITLYQSTCYNLSRTLTWPEFEHTKDALFRIQKDLPPNSSRPHSLEVNWIYEPITNFYIEQYALPLTPVVRMDQPSFQSEYLLLQHADTPPGYHVLRYYPEGTLCLFKKSAK